MWWWVGIKLIVGFQPLRVISSTPSWIGWCRYMRGDLMWTYLVWAERSTPDNFWVPISHRFNSATGEQKGITQTIYTDSEPPSQMPNSLMPSAKLRSANLPFFTCLHGVTRSGIEPRPPAPRADALTYAGAVLGMWVWWHEDWIRINDPSI